MYVDLGNPRPVVIDGLGRARVEPRRSTTRFTFPDDLSIDEAVHQVVALWSSLTDREPGTEGELVPVWIESDSTKLRSALCKRWTVKVKDVKKPGGWDAD